MSKATKRDMIEREEDIREKLSDGLDVRDFCLELAKKHKCSELSIKRQYYQVLNDMVEVSVQAKEELRVKLMLRNDDLYKKAKADSNLKLAADINNLQAKIGGLYQPEKKQTEEVEKKQPVFNIVSADQDNVVPMVSEAENEPVGK